MSHRRHRIINRPGLPLFPAPLLKILQNRLGVEVDPVTIIKPAEPLAELAGGEGIAVADLGINACPAKCAILAVDAYLQRNEVILSRAGYDPIEQVAEAGAFVADPYFQGRG